MVNLDDITSVLSGGPVKSEVVEAEIVDEQKEEVKEESEEVVKEDKKQVKPIFTEMGNYEDPYSQDYLTHKANVMECDKQFSMFTITPQ